jgi:hypothetical protein
MEGKNSIEYDLLDNIEINDKVESGYFVIPERLESSQRSNISGPS